MNHWVWEDDPNESLCGQDLSNKSWTDAIIDCQMCLEVDAFVKLVEAFAQDRDMKDSLIAALSIWGEHE